MIAPAFALATATIAIATGFWINRRVVGWLPDDPPRPGRKQHLRPVPLAGILLLPTMLPWLLAAEAWLTTAGLLLAAALGFADDRRKEHGDGLAWHHKALGLLLATALLALAGTPSPTVSDFLLGWALVFVITNAVNFLDNMNGTSAATAAVGLLSLAATGAPPFVAAAGFAAVAFLPWNWPRANLFLGDSGAYALGGTLGQAVVASMRIDHAAVAAAAIPLLDFVQVVTARLWLRVPPWVGDRRHLTHILANLGVPTTAVAPACAALAGGAWWLSR